MKLIITAFIFFGAVAHAASRSAFIIEWTEIAAKYLSPAEMKTAEYILNDILWQDNQRTMDARLYDRIVDSKKTGLEQLKTVAAKAARGDRSARHILLTLLETSSRPRSLKDLLRSGLPSGKAVAGPEPLLTVLDDGAREYVSRAMVSSMADTRELVRYFAEQVLSDPQNVALAEGVTSLIAQPRFAKDPRLTNFFLLMSVHPYPRVRIGGLFGLAQAAPKDSFVRGHLLSVGQKPVSSLYEKADFESVKKIVERVGDERWEKVYLPLFQRWFADPIQNRHLDLGDYNMDRIAQAAASQALLFSVAGIEREIEIEYADEEVARMIERVDASTELPRLPASLDEGGAALAVYTHLWFPEEEEDRPPLDEPDQIDGDDLRFISRMGMSVEPQPENAWILKGLDSSSRHEAFKGMLSTGVQVNYGGLNSVLSFYKYKVLDLPAPREYFEALAGFKRQLRAKYDEWVAENKRLGIKLVNVAELNGVLRSETQEVKQDPGNVVSFGKRTKKSKAESEAPHDSIFTVGFDSMFATRALAALGDEETATEVLLGLLPERWATTPAEGERLAEQLNSYGRFEHRRIKRATLTETGKRQALQYLFNSLELSMTKPKARTLLIRWLANLKDPTLAKNAREAFGHTCITDLSLPKR